VDGKETLERCLRALDAQADPPEMEVIVPFDSTVADAPAIASRHPAARFLDLGVLETSRPAAGFAGQHELYDRRRAAGLAAASGSIVAILEDRGAPRADWARTAVALHELPHGVIGGAVENGNQRLLARSVYSCDFARYQLPFEAGPAAWVTDVNVTYKRAALEATRELWRERFHEPTVHGALLARGETLWLSPVLVVEQRREGLGFRRLLAERFAWGRLFAATRVAGSSRRRRAALALLSPLLPALLFGRQSLLHARKRVSFWRFLRAAPCVLALLIAWSLGEATGYATGIG
jgi:hypothetical protein